MKSGLHGSIANPSQGENLDRSDPAPDRLILVGAETCVRELHLIGHAHQKINRLSDHALFRCR